MGKNKNRLTLNIGGTLFYYHYNTLVGIMHDGEVVVRENIWGVGTSRYLNDLDGGDKKSRLCKGDFDVMVLDAISDIGLSEIPEVISFS